MAAHTAGTSQAGPPPRRRTTPDAALACSPAANQAGLPSPRHPSEKQPAWQTRAARDAPGCGLGWSPCRTTPGCGCPSPAPRAGLSRIAGPGWAPPAAHQIRRSSSLFPPGADRAPDASHRPRGSAPAPLVVRYLTAAEPRRPAQR